MRLIFCTEEPENLNKEDIWISMKQLGEISESPVFLIDGFYTDASHRYEFGENKTQVDEYTRRFL